MGLRDSINQRPRHVTGLTCAVIVLALGVIVYQQRTFPPRTPAQRPGVPDPTPRNDQPVADPASSTTSIHATSVHPTNLPETLP